MAARDRRTVAGSTLVAIVCAVAFVSLAILLPAEGPAVVDVRGAALVQGLAVPVAAWESLTMLGGSVLVAVDVAVVIVLLARREVVMAVVFAATLITVTLGVDAIKDTVARARPAEPMVIAHGGSYPSGHAFLGAVSYGLLALVAWRSEAPRTARTVAIVGAGALVFLIGCSRVALGVHHPTDVIGGWLGGIAVLALVVAVTTGLSRSPDVSEVPASP